MFIQQLHVGGVLRAWQAIWKVWGMWSQWISVRVMSATVPKLCGPSRSESRRHTFCDLKVGSGCYRSLGNEAPAHADDLHWWILGAGSETTWCLAWAAFVTVHLDILSPQDPRQPQFLGTLSPASPQPTFPCGDQGWSLDPMGFY